MVTTFKAIQVIDNVKNADCISITPAIASRTGSRAAPVSSCFPYAWFCLVNYRKLAVFVEGINAVWRCEYCKIFMSEFTLGTCWVPLHDIDSSAGPWRH